MARHSISGAAKLTGISRTNLYKNYINKGLLSVSRDKQNRPYIDTSELSRVFDLNTETQQNEQQTTPIKTPEHTEIHYLKQLLSDKESQLRKSEEREVQLQDEIKRYQLLLENKNKRRKSLISRVIDAVIDN